MSLLRLRTFVEVYRQRSMSGAARTLNITQPAVSQHILGLEIAIGRKLFERGGRGVAPTIAADELAADIGDSLDAAELALSTARARSPELEGAIQLIGHADFLAELVAPRLRPVLETGLRVRFHTAARDLFGPMLIEGHCDIGLAAYPGNDPRIRVEPVRSEAIMAVASPEVAAAINAAADFEGAVRSQPLAAYDFELPMLTQWCDHHRFGPAPLGPAVVSQDLRALRAIICSGFGWTVMPEYMCHAAISSGELVEFGAKEPRPRVDYFMLWTPASLRHPRIAHARQNLLWALKN